MLSTRFTSSKPSKVIQFFPVAPGVPTYAPKPEPLSKNIPVWWREQEVYAGGSLRIEGGKGNQTIKKCPSVLDVLGTGYLLKVPVDISVDTTGDRIRWQLPKGNVSWKAVSLHDRQQVSEMPFDHMQYCSDLFRIHPLWGYRTPPGYSVLVTHPPYLLDVPWKVLPAVMDTDKYAPDGAYSMLMNRGFQGVIKQGTPLAVIVPFAREPWISVVQEEYDSDLIDGQGSRIRSVFTGGYRSNFWAKKEYR